MLETHLAPDIVYEFRVQAETTGGPGPFSNSTQFRTPEDGTIIVISSAWLSEFESSTFLSLATSSSNGASWTNCHVPQLNRT